MAAACVLEEEFLQQCGRVAFSAYAAKEALRNTLNPLEKANGGRPLDSQRPPVVFESDHEVQVVVWELRDAEGPYCAIGIRGTDTVQNGVQDLKCKQVKLDSTESSIFNSSSENPPPMVHKGFREAFLAMRSQISETLKSDFSEVFTRIVVAGHSLGGALAVLVGLDLAQSFEMSHISVVTFGKPHVGNATFRDFFCKRFKGHLLANFCSSADPIPKICQIASVAGAGKYEHECKPYFLDCLADQALEALPAILSGTSSLKTKQSVLKESGTQMKNLIRKFHSCTYYWEQIQVFRKPDRRSFRRLEKTLVAGHKTTQVLSKATSQANSSSPGSCTLVLRKLFELVPKLPKCRGLSPQVALTLGAGAMVVGMCSAAWVAVRGSDERKNVSEALQRLEYGQQRVNIGVEQILNDVTRLQSEVKDLKEGQNRIERMIVDLHKDIKLALQEMKIMDIKSNCQMMLDLLLSNNQERIREQAELLKDAAKDQATLKTHLQQIWEQVCAKPQDRLDSEVRGRIDMLCLLLVQSIQLELSYRSFLCSDQFQGQQQIAEELQRHISFSVHCYGPTLGRMAWIGAGHGNSIGTAALADVAQRFRVACGCGSPFESDSRDSDELDVVLASKREQKFESWKPQNFKLTTDDWYTVLALDSANNEAKLVLSGLEFQSRTLPAVARHHFNLALECSPRLCGADERCRLATLDGLIALSLDDELLCACEAEDKAAIQSALFDLVDVLWDADRLADFLVALSRLLPGGENDAAFPVLQIAPEVWEHLSQRIHSSSWERRVLAGGRQLLQRLLPGHVQQSDCDMDHDCNPATKASTLRAWDSLARQSRQFHRSQQDNAVDTACMHAITRLEGELTNEGIRYKLSYDQDTKHVIVAFASKGLQNHFDVGLKDEASGPQNKMATLCLLEEEGGPEVNAHVLSLVKKVANFNVVSSQLQAECSQHNTKSFVFTGHGLSGSCGVVALAGILSSKLGDLDGLAGRVVTFGAPQVLGDIESFPNLQCLTGVARCHVHVSDSVPMLFRDWGERNDQWRKFWQEQAEDVAADVASQMERLRSAIAQREADCEARKQELKVQEIEQRGYTKAEKRKAKASSRTMVAAGVVAATLATGGLATGVAMAAGGAAVYTRKKACASAEQLQHTIEQQKRNVTAAMDDLHKYEQQLSSVAPSLQQKLALIHYHACEACSTERVGRKYISFGQFRFLVPDAHGEYQCEELEAEDASDRLLTGFETRLSDAAACGLERKANAALLRDRLLWDHELPQYDKALAVWTSAFPERAGAAAIAEIATCLGEALPEVSAPRTAGVSRRAARQSAGSEENVPATFELPGERTAETSIEEDFDVDVDVEARGNSTEADDKSGSTQEGSEPNADPDGDESDVDVYNVEIQRWVLLPDPTEEEQLDDDTAAPCMSRSGSTEDAVPTSQNEMRQSAEQSQAPPYCASGAAPEEEGCCCVVS